VIVDLDDQALGKLALWGVSSTLILPLDEVGGGMSLGMTAAEASTCLGETMPGALALGLSSIMEPDMRVSPTSNLGGT
jgi:hypothetical protein